jgi:hypothetical protein
MPFLDRQYKIEAFFYCPNRGDNTALLSVPSAGTACFVAFAAKNRSPDLGLERYLVTASAIIADDLKSLRSILPLACLF